MHRIYKNNFRIAISAVVLVVVVVVLASYLVNIKSAKTKADDQNISLTIIALTPAGTPTLLALIGVPLWRVSSNVK